MEVVVLEEQMRQSGEATGVKKLHSILSNIRKGKITDEDLEALNSRAIGSGAPDAPKNLNDPRLVNARFLVLRHSIISLLSQSEVPEHARQNNKRLVKFYSDHCAVTAEDTFLPLPKPLLDIARSKPTTGKSLRKTNIGTKSHVNVNISNSNHNHC